MVVATFDTLHRENSFRNPSKEGASVPILNELAAPHVESFNALFADSGLPIPHGHEERNVGLLGLAIKNIEDKVLFDGPDGTHEQGKGNKLRSGSYSYLLYPAKLLAVWIESISIGRPKVADKTFLKAPERAFYPSEVRNN